MTKLTVSTIYIYPCPSRPRLRDIAAVRLTCRSGGYCLRVEQLYDLLRVHPRSIQAGSSLLFPIKNGRGQKLVMTEPDESGIDCLFHLPCIVIDGLRRFPEQSHP